MKRVRDREFWEKNKERRRKKLKKVSFGLV